MVDVERDHRTGHHAAADRVAADGPLAIRATCSSFPACCPTIRSARAIRRRSSGMNYSDIARRRSASRRDNFYYFDGINITDPVTGTFGANLNTEIIQEQKVITGGIPAEFVGTPGLHLQRRHEVGQQRLPRVGELLLPEHRPGRREQERRRPGVLDLRRGLHHRRADRPGQGVVLRQLPPRRPRGRRDAASTPTVPATVNNKQHQGYAKGTWAPTADDLVSFTS